MDMTRIGQIMNDLRLANEVEYAAEMDVADAKANVEFYKCKLAATKERHIETMQAAQDVLDRLAETVNQMTASPLMLTAELLDSQEC